MKKIINERYELTACTAIAACDGMEEEKRQPALFFHDADDGFRNGDSVIFGYSLADFESEEDLALADPGAFESDWEVLKSVRFAGGVGLPDPGSEG